MRVVKDARKMSIPSRQKKVHNQTPFTYKLVKPKVDNTKNFKPLSDFWGDELIL